MKVTHQSAHELSTHALSELVRTGIRAACSDEHTVATDAAIAEAHAALFVLTQRAARFEVVDAELTRRRACA